MTCAVVSGVRAFRKQKCKLAFPRSGERDLSWVGSLGILQHELQCTTLAGASHVTAGRLGGCQVLPAPELPDAL